MQEILTLLRTPVSCLNRVTSAPVFVPKLTRTSLERSRHGSRPARQNDQELHVTFDERAPQASDCISKLGRAPHAKKRRH